MSLISRHPNGHEFVCPGQPGDSVTDTGDGLDADELERVFERFYRVDPSRSRDRGSSGIGLTIARALVDAQGGRMWAESDGRGQGSRFSMRLPAA